MLLLISPAKTLDFSNTEVKVHTTPRMLAKSEELVGLLKQKSSKEIQNLMSVSEKIANLNVSRFQSFHTPFQLDNAKQALLAFKGDVYTGLEADTFDDKDLEFAQQHLRILSGLYGVLRPLDLMQPYRLEMGTKMETPKGSDLYQFWEDQITRVLNEDLDAQGDDIIINLASNEYFKSVHQKALKGRLIDVVFKDEKNGKFKIIAFYAKKARGMMCHYVIKNKITKPEYLKGFDYDGYLFNEALSSKNELVFTR